MVLDLTRILLGLIIERASVDTQSIANLSHGIRRPQRPNYSSFFRPFSRNNAKTFFSMSIATVILPTRCSSCAIRSVYRVGAITISISRIMQVSTGLEKAMGRTEGHHTRNHLLPLPQMYVNRLQGERKNQIYRQ